MRTSIADPTPVPDPTPVADATSIADATSVADPDRVTGAPGAAEVGCPRPVVAVAIESGPAVDVPVALTPGRHVIGRARGVAVHLADAAVEPHHALLDVAADGTLSVVQLAGRTPLVVDGAPAPGPGATRLAADSTVAIGATRLRLGPPGPPPPPVRTGDVPGDPPGRPAARTGAPVDAGDDRRMVMREPRAVPFLAIAAVEAPSGDPPDRGTHGSHPGMLVGALAGVTGGLVMALVTGSPAVLLFGIVASVASFATWLVTRVRHVREIRRRGRRHREAIDAFAVAVTDAAARIRTHHAATVPGVGRRLADVDGRGLWARRTGHPDAFTVTLGRGDLERPVPISAGNDLAPELLAITEPARTLTDVEVPVRLDAAERTVVAVEGPGAAAIVRSVVVQLAVATGPADWCVRAVVRDPAAERWIDRLPHAAGVDASSSVVDARDAGAVAEVVHRLDDGDDRRVVIVCDAPTLLATRTGPLRRLLDGGRPVTIVLAVADGSGLPAVCGAVLRTGCSGTAHWTPDLHDAAATASWTGVRVRTAGVTRAVAERIAGRLARYVDPEDPSAAAGRLPRALRLADLPDVPRTVDAVLDRWAAGGDDPAPSALVGTSVDGVIELDLVRDGPHGLVAGTTGAGKSELLRTLVVQLAARVDPRHLSLVLVDYKGGSTFDACADLPHTVGVVTDLDDGLAARALTSLEAELHRRERILREHRAADLTAYRALPGVDPLPRLVVVIDEFAAMAKELPEFLAALVGIAQRGRSLGIHLVLATQRPAGVVDDAVRANTNLRIALRLHDVADAMDVVGDRAPATFPRGVPGRAVVRLGPDDIVEFQAAACTGPAVADDDGSDTTELGRLVGRVRAAATRSGFTGAHRPWLPPLDDVVRAGDPPAPGALGWIDDPAAQARRPLQWDRTGNLALVGALGSGTTTTLVALAASAIRPAIHVVDGRGAPALAALADLPACSGVVRVDDAERVDRLLAHLCDEIDRRRTGMPEPSSDGGHVLLVDGFDVLRRSLDDPGRVDAVGVSLGLDRLHRVLGEGPAVGVVVAAVVAPEGPGAAAALARFQERWVFHLDDPSTGPLLGVPAARVPGDAPGRLVVASTGLEAQVALPPASPATGVRRRVAPIEVLPAVIDAADLADLAGDAGDAVSESRPGGGASGARLPIGRRYDDLGVAWFEIGPSDRVVVAGPRRSGRSTLLRALADAWRRAHPDGTVTTVVAGEPVPDVTVPTVPPGDDAGSGRPRLVVIDDADRVDDDDGVLARLVAERGGAAPVAVIVAGRADAVRAYDHWAAGARRDRLGFVMTGTADTDADVIGATPPRRCPLAPRPGLAWMIAHGECTLVQTVVASTSTPGAVGAAS